MKLTLKDVERLKEEGKMREYKLPCQKLKNHETRGRKVAKHFFKKSKALDYIAWNLLYWCNQQAVTLEEEYKFHPDRGWKFDYAIPSLKIAVEFEGGIFDRNGSHTRVKDISRDIEKYNAAQLLGWTVLRFTTINYESLISELNKAIDK